MSGLDFPTLFMAAGQYRDVRCGSTSIRRAHGSLNQSDCPEPDLRARLRLLFFDLLSPDQPKGFDVMPSPSGLDNIRPSSAWPRSPWPFCSQVRWPRTYVARAQASAPTRYLSCGPCRRAARIDDMAPMISNLRICFCPILDVLPSICLPPLGCCRGTRPSQGAKSRPRLNSSMGGANASIAVAPTRPIPGIA